MCQGLGPKKHDKISESDRNTAASLLSVADAPKVKHAPAVSFSSNLSHDGGECSRCYVLKSTANFHTKNSQTKNL